MTNRRGAGSNATASRTEDAEVEESVAPRRSEEVWMEDGNIILQAEDVQFRVHRAVLSKYSPIFADLFKVPQPPAEPTVDGCPVVKFHDSAQDLEYMLLALYGDPRYMNVRKAIPFAAVTAMVRLGKKYDIPHLSDEGVTRLKLEYPTTLAEYDNVAAASYQHISFPDSDIDFSISNITAIATLALECGIQSILPTVYGHLVQVSDLVRPCRTACIYASLTSVSDGLLELVRPRLPYDDMRQFLIGRETLRKEHVDTVLKRLDDLGMSGDCEAPEKCRAASGDISNFLLKTPNILGGLNTFLQWKDFLCELTESLRKLDHLCRTCKRKAEHSHNAGREEAWYYLPSFFQLPAWGDLTDFSP